jgi:hypothetical protein
MTNAEFIELARLTMAVGETPGDAALVAALISSLDRTDDDEGGLVHLAIRALSGRPCQISTDDPAIVHRARSLAADLGATFAKFEQHAGMTIMDLAPAPRQ